MDIPTILASVSRSVMVEAAYQAIRFLKEGFSYARASQITFFHGTPRDIAEEAINTALAIIREIEKIEGVPVETLGYSNASKYICILSDIVQSRFSSDFGCDEERGRELLESLRKTPLGYFPNGFSEHLA